ncbi:hypothetical protein PIB30_068088, partial [Stylosanthes scabra]|nr:hypothetical protein [Stylosanthes scabra]
VQESFIPQLHGMQFVSVEEQVCHMRYAIRYVTFRYKKGYAVCTIKITYQMGDLPKRTAFHDGTMAARKLSMNVIQQCIGKLEPRIKQLLLSAGPISPGQGMRDQSRKMFDRRMDRRHL